MSRVIVIGGAELAALEELVRYAETHVVPLARVVRNVSGAEPPIGELEPHRLELPGGLRIVLSLEEQPSGVYRHASMSIFPRNPGDLPNPALVNEVLPLLGFRCALEQARVWVEGGAAINILAKEPAPAPSAPRSVT